MNGRGGYATLLQALGALPATPAEAAAAAGASTDVVRTWLLHLQRMGVLAITAKVRVGLKHYTRVYDWARDGVESLPLKEPKRREAPDVTLIHFAALAREMVMPCTVRDLSEATGMDVRSLHRLLGLMRAANVARVSGWVRKSNGYAAAWQLGKGRDAAKPAPQSRKVINARAWAARRERLAMRPLLSAAAPAERQAA
jgi:hypothetical protein